MANPGRVIPRTDLRHDRPPAYSPCFFAPLATSCPFHETPPLPSLVSEARDALERVVNDLARQEHTLQAREAVRRP